MIDCTDFFKDVRHRPLTEAEYAIPQLYAAYASPLVCAAQTVHRHNLALAARIDSPDFDPGLELDATLNGGMAYIEMFYGTIAAYDHNHIPWQAVEFLTKSTDLLMGKIERRYHKAESHRLALAFRTARTLWHGPRPDPTITRAMYLHRLYEAQGDVEKMINDQSCAFFTDHTLPVVVVPSGGSQSSPVSEKRGKGVSEYHGHEVHRSIFVEGGKFLVVNGVKYSFSAARQWAIVERFLRSIKCGFDNSSGNFPVDFTSADFNVCHGPLRQFVAEFVERQRCARKIRNSAFTGKARFRVELLK